MNIHAAQNDQKAAIEFYGSKVLLHFQTGGRLSGGLHRDWPAS